MEFHDHASFHRGITGTVEMIVAIGVVSLFVAMFCSLVIGFPVLLVLGFLKMDRVWVVAIIGAILGFAVAATGFFSVNPFSTKFHLSPGDVYLGLILAANGALTGIAATLWSREGQDQP
jgi:hypothetical protein